MKRFGRYGEGFWAGKKYLTSVQLIELSDKLEAIGEKEGDIDIHIHCYDADFDDDIEVYYHISFAKDAISPESSSWSYHSISKHLFDISDLLSDKVQMIKGAGLSLYYSDEDE